MGSKHGVLCQKVVTSAHINLAKLEIPRLSEAVRQVIRDARLQSLEGLLGPDSERVMRRLVEHYWRVR